MSLDNAIRQVESAQIELRSVASGAEGWKDSQRDDFDKQRMKPLDEAASRLLAALQRANEQLAAATRLQAD